MGVLVYFTQKIQPPPSISSLSFSLQTFDPFLPPACSDGLREARTEVCVKLSNIVWDYYNIRVKLKSQKQNKPSLLYIELLTKRHPLPRKLRRLRQRFKRTHRRSVIGDITRYLIHRQNRQHRVRRHQRRLLHRIHRTHKEIHRRQQIRLAVALVAEREAIEVGLAIDREPFGELIEDPGRRRREGLEGGERGDTGGCVFFV